MRDLVGDINSCEGYGNCYGKVRGKKPIIFDFNPEDVEIMVITEQPFKGKDKESIKNLKYKNRVPYRLKELMGEEYRQNIENEEGRFYWTHFIKCLGNFRKKGEGKKNEDIDINKCAEEHLINEIKSIEPLLIISIGSTCSKWILDKANIIQDWRDIVIEELRGTEGIIVKIAGVDTKVFFLFHPSLPSGIGWFVDWKLKDLIKNVIDSLN